MRKSTSTAPFNSFTAASVPAWAMVQNVEALLDTNASFSFLPAGGLPPAEGALSSFFPQLVTVNTKANALSTETICFNFIDGVVLVLVSGLKFTDDGDKREF